MKTTFLILATLLSAASLRAETTSSLTIPVVGERFIDTGSARASFYEKCDEHLRELSSQMKENLLSQSNCNLEGSHETFQSVEFRGTLVMKFARPLVIEKRAIDTGYATDSAKAWAQYDRLCKNWKTSLADSQKKHLVLETCGITAEDKFYQPRVSSLAVRIQKARVPFKKNLYCHCKASEKEREGMYRPRRNFDLMVLNMDGSYDRIKRFSTLMDCEDALEKEPSCFE